MRKPSTRNAMVKNVLVMFLYSENSRPHGAHDRVFGDRDLSFRQRRCPLFAASGRCFLAVIPLFRRCYFRCFLAVLFQKTASFTKAYGSSFAA
jgi:hypothetical protein